jgi:methionine salvage enolase-phosphatase E1
MNQNRVLTQTHQALPPNFLFISDVAKELDAARDAVMQTMLCVRTESPERVVSAHRVVHSFKEVFPGS